MKGHRAQIRDRHRRHIPMSRGRVEKDAHRAGAAGRLGARHTVLDGETLLGTQAQALRGQLVTVRSGLALSHITPGHDRVERPLQVQGAKDALNPARRGAGDQSHRHPHRRQLQDQPNRRGNRREAQIGLVRPDFLQHLPIQVAREQLSDGVFRCAADGQTPDVAEVVDESMVDTQLRPQADDGILGIDQNTVQVEQDTSDLAFSDHGGCLRHA
jgi:hypothetical protein